MHVALHVPQHLDSHLDSRQRAKAELKSKCHDMALAARKRLSQHVGVAKNCSGQLFWANTRS
jgi:hypothetical protein